MSTLTVMRTEVANEIGMNVSDSAELALIDQWLNEGVTDVLLRTSCKVLPTTMNLIASTKDYTLDTTILSILDMYVTYSGNDYEMTHTTYRDIFRLRRNTTSTPTSPPTRYAVTGSNLLMVWPTPSSADVVTILYVPRPATLTTGANTPDEIPAEWHRLIVQYALWRAGSADDDQSSGQGERYRQAYEQSLLQMRRTITRKGGHRLAPAKSPVRMNRYLVKDPSVVIR